jgi:dTDP-4-dehydrorhamnose 3,5-epimerase-like enzyme
MLNFQQKTGKDGLLKCFLSYDQGNSSMNYPTPVNVNEDMQLNLDDRNTYLNASYRDILSEKFNLKAGLSYSDDRNDMDLGNDRLREKVRVYQGRYTITWIQSETFSLRFGNEYWHKEYDQDYFYSLENTDYKSGFNDDFITAYAEGDIAISSKLALRLGGRFEYSALMEKVNAAPRASMAFKTSQHSQVSVAYGRFYQSPGDVYLRFNNTLNYENATHYIGNFQYMKDDRIFRVEAYYKDYSNLVKFDSLHSHVPSSYNNNGNGYARGVDIFWRDNKSITFLEYWISYSYIDTRRDYLNYPNMATPTFVSNHTASAVVKYFVPGINTLFGGTYTFATGRTYYNPNNQGFLTDRASNYNDLSLNLSYLTHLWDQFTIIYFSVSNVLGAENVFGYNYSLNPNSNGVYDAVAVEPGARRFWFLGVFISLNVKQ